MTVWDIVGAVGISAAIAAGLMILGRWKAKKDLEEFQYMLISNEDKKLVTTQELTKLFTEKDREYKQLIESVSRHPTLTPADTGENTLSSD
jgi:hypothetical protein